MNRWRSYKSWKLIIGLLGLTVLIAGSTANAATFQLPVGPEVKLKFNADTKISSGELEPGAILAVTSVAPIRIGEVLLVAAGASGTAVVVEVEKASAPGKPGKIVVEFTELGTRGGYRTVDGTPLKLAGKIEKVGKGKKILAYVTIVGIFLIKGGQGEIDTGEIYTATIGETVVLQSD